MSDAHFAECDLIARAAKLMRARAEQANTDTARTPYGIHGGTPVPEDEWGPLVDNYLGGPIGQHCAAWTPAVALAVAAWLEVGANPYACVNLAPMVAVARAYLSELERLEGTGRVASDWEDGPRPRRRMYRLAGGDAHPGGQEGQGG